MTDKPADLSTLIERVEAAEAGDRELDAAIFEAASGDGWREAFRHECLDALSDREVRQNVARHAPAYSASIDAAMTLIPSQPKILDKGHRYWLTVDERTMPRYPLPPSMQWGYSQDTFFEAWIRRTPDRFIGKGATAALAIVAAALRATLETGEASIKRHLWHDTAR